MPTGDEPAEIIAALPDSYQVAEDGVLDVATGEGVLANDGDEQTGPLTATLVANPAHGTVTLNPDGSFSYAPSPNYAGPDSFTYRAAEGQATSDVVQVTIAVQGVNDPPAAVADSYTTTEDTALTVDAAHGVLENDEDVDDNPLTASLVNQPTHGTLTLSADGSFTYTPTVNFSGSDSFAYRVSDGTVQSEPVSVALTITAADDAPTAVADSYTVNEDSVLNVADAQGVLANDSNADGDGTVTVTQAPTHGTLTLNADGSFAYTPSANFAGTDSFTYTLSDGVNQSTAAATITIVDQADPPTATNDTLTVADDGSGHTVDVLANDSFAPDADESLTVVSVTQGSQGGTVTLSNGQVSYQPATGFTGTETFQYTIEDSDELTSTATVTVTVSDTAGNRISGFVYRDRDGDGMRDDNEMGVPGVVITLNGTATGGESINRSTMTGDDGSYLFGNVPAGTYEVLERQPTALADGAESSGVTGANVATNDRIGNLVISGDLLFAANNFAERQFHSAYISIAWFFASATSTSDVFRESMADAEASAGEEGLAEAIRNGGTTPPVDTNRAPVAGADTYTTAQDTPLSVDAAAGVLANDSDPDGDAITATLVTSAEHGTLTLGANGSFSYTPAAGFSGADGFSYRASDGTLTSSIVQVTLNVTSISATAPVAVADTYTVLHNTTLTVDSASGLLKNDTDDDGNSLTAIKVTDPTNGALTLNANGSFVYVPNNGFSGTDSFTYQASDGGRTSNITTVTLTVNEPNSAPVPTNDIYFVTRDTTLTVNAATGVLINDDDAQDDSLTATLVQTTTNGALTFNNNGSFTYVPNTGFVGSDTFTYSASDGLLSSNAATVTISVTSTNTAPVAMNDAYTVDQDETLNVTSANGLLANDEDNELANMTAQLVAGPTNGTVNLMANGSFTYTPAAGFSGSDSFTYRANDGLADSNTATVTMTVNDVNDLPQAVNEEFTVIQGNQLMVSAATGVLINDTDLDDDSLTATLVTATANGTLTLNADGSFQYAPNTGFFGTDSFTYQAHDGQGASNTATVTVHVTPLNEFSLIENTSAGTLVGQLNPTDPDLNGQLIFQVEDAQLPALLRLVPDDHRTGSPTSSLVLIAYIDFQSPASATYHAILEQLADEFNGELLMVRRHLPVTQEHGNALAAAIAAEAAGVQGGFNEMAEMLFAQQQNWADEVDPQAEFEDYATQLGLNPTQFVEDLHDASLAARVQRDRDAATQLGATTTPAIYLAGEVLSQLPSTFDEFRGLIQTQLDQVDDVFRINAATGQILVRDSAALDFETTPTFQLPVRITDLEGDTEVVQAVINLTDAGENVPVANPDTYTLDEDSVLTVAGVDGILANDVDDDGDSLLPSIVANVTHGMLTLQLNGAFTYTPDENFSGTDSFTYRVSDGQTISATTTVTLNVTPVNERPVAVDDNYSVQMNSILAVEATSGVLVNDSDPDDDPLIVQLVNQPSHGTLLLAADGTFQYTPDNEFFGTDSFLYQANDGLDDSNTATVTITVSPLEPLGEGEGEDSQAGALLSASLVDLAIAELAEER
jgi:VCBS repeat-containing protein